ncbi:MAG: hypothetical protein JRN29_04250, partial [Nitrososphaerota archaeon]|nr:hypothetical protein [Nitrososphaerota archaeon]
MKVGARAEWDRLRTVMMHRPGIEMHLGLLAPYASLYERAFNLGDALLELGKTGRLRCYVRADGAAIVIVVSPSAARCGLPQHWVAPPT